MAEAELGKIVNMILENPELVEKIKSMAEGDGAMESTETSGESTPKEDVPVMAPPSPRSGSKRNELLRALRSFVSPERQKSLDTMMTIANVLDTMKTR